MMLTVKWLLCKGENSIFLKKKLIILGVNSILRIISVFYSKKWNELIYCR